MNAPTKGATVRAGVSTMCLRTEHDFCTVAGARCSCDCHGPTGQTARKAPAHQPKDPFMHTPPPAPPRGATVALVADTPPPPSRRGRRGDGVLDEASAHVPELKRAAGTWFRVATWPGKSSANSARSNLGKRHPDVEWVARVLPEGGSGLWARARPEGET